MGCFPSGNGRKISNNDLTNKIKKQESQAENAKDDNSALLLKVYDSSPQIKIEYAHDTKKTLKESLLKNDLIVKNKFLTHSNILKDHKMNLDITSKNNSGSKLTVNRSNHFSETEIDSILNALKENFLLREVDEDTLSRLVDTLMVIKYDENTFVFNKGDIGDKFYIVKSGMYEIHLNKETKIYKSGNTFGELSLMHRDKRSASVQCVQMGELYSIEGDIFRELIREINQDYLQERISFLMNIPLFSKSIFI